MRHILKLLRTIKDMYIEFLLEKLHLKQKVKQK